MSALLNHAARCAFVLGGAFSTHCMAGSTQHLIDLRRIDAVVGNPAAGKTKAGACMGCHGRAGIAQVPTFPNLAGQHVEYLYWALIEFQREARADSPMTAQVAKLNRADLRDLAAWFAALPAAKPGVASTADTRGATLFHDGDPVLGIPPCQGCHGANADGHPLAATQARYRTYPILRGQHADYLIQRLDDFRAGKHALSSNDHIMTPIAQSLDDASIHDLATWLQAGAP
jgi:cytochrome c553